MGRELKRVPLDFDWPINKTWQGFLNPWYAKCGRCVCDGTGLSPTAKKFHDQWYGNAAFYPDVYGVPQLLISDYHFRETVIWKIRRSGEIAEQDGTPNHYLEEFDTFDEAVDSEVMRMWMIVRSQWCHHLSQDDVDALVDDDRLIDFTSHFIKGEGWIKNDPATHPTAAEVNAWSLSGLAHDAINCGVCVRARCTREEVEHLCEHCNGTAQIWESTEAEESADNWEPTEPPTGEGYQLWETTSEGSPVTPVFATSAELAEWLVMNDTSITEDTTLDQWMRFIEGPGWAPTMVFGGGVGMQSGVKAIGTKESA